MSLIWAICQKHFYFWLSYVVQFAIPFLLLLIMNSTIIHVLRTRSILQAEHKVQGQDQCQGQTNKMKSSETQIIAILLLVAFSFFILITPMYAFIVYSMVVDYTKSPLWFCSILSLLQCYAQNVLYQQRYQLLSLCYIRKEI